MQTPPSYDVRRRRGSYTLFSVLAPREDRAKTFAADLLIEQGLKSIRAVILLFKHVHSRFVFDAYLL